MKKSLSEKQKNSMKYIVTSCQYYATDRGNRGYEHMLAETRLRIPMFHTRNSWLFQEWAHCYALGMDNRRFTSNEPIRVSFWRVGIGDFYSVLHMLP
jgi:hypothetical protein